MVAPEIAVHDVVVALEPRYHWYVALVPLGETVAVSFVPTFGSPLSVTLTVGPGVDAWYVPEYDES